MLDELRRIVASDDHFEAQAVSAADAIRRAGSYRWVGVYEVTDDEIGIVGWSGPGAPAHPRFPRSQGLSGAAVAARETVAVGDVTQDPRYLTAFGSTRSEIIVPILAGGEVVGTLDVESEQVDAFDDEARAGLEACAELLRGLWS